MACSEAHYPYGQQYYNHQHGGYSNQNANVNNYNNINNNNNVNSNYNPNNIQNNNNNNNSNRRNAHNNNPLLAINLQKIYLGDFEYMPTPDGYRFS